MDVVFPPAMPPPYHIAPPTSARPPLPPYHVVVGNTAAYSQFLVQQYGAGGGRVAGTGRRPPLPDYHAATQMAHIARRKHQHHLLATNRTNNLHEAGVAHFYMTNGNHNEEDDEDYDDDDDIITDGKYEKQQFVSTLNRC